MLSSAELTCRPYLFKLMAELAKSNGLDSIFALIAHSCLRLQIRAINWMTATVLVHMGSCLL